LTDLSVNIAGLRFKNPVIVASGTPTHDIPQIERCFKEGAAAVVTKTITYARLHQLQPRPRFHVVYPRSIGKGYFSLYSIELMSCFPPEKWSKKLREIKNISKKYDSIVIASIAGRNLDEWSRLAKLVEEAGADAIELNLSCPHVEEGEGTEMGKVAGSDPETAGKIVKNVKETVSIPVIGKLTPQGANPLAVAKGMVKSGADILVATARFQGIIVDVETQKPIIWGGPGGYGGPWMLPISANWVLKIYKSRLGVPIIGSGGIMQADDALQLIMLGATAIQICTTVIVNGYQIIGKIISELSQWLYRHGYSSIRDLLGKAVNNVISFEDLDRWTIYKAEVTSTLCTGCGTCVRSCFYGALKLQNNKAVVKKDLCEGCGLCVALCPTKAIQLAKKDI